MVRSGLEPGTFSTTQARIRRSVQLSQYIALLAYIIQAIYYANNTDSTLQMYKLRNSINMCRSYFVCFELPSFEYIESVNNESFLLTVGHLFKPRHPKYQTYKLTK